MFDWLVSAIERAGSFGVMILMLAENLFPPIPSELIMPLAGFSAARGEMSLWTVIVAGVVGSLLGALFWYYVGRWFGIDRLKSWSERYGRWLTISPDDIDAASEWFRRHGRLAVAIGRLIPAIRTVISIPAGMGGMPLGPFLGYTLVGTTIWVTFLAASGFILEARYALVRDWVNPISNAVVAAGVACYAYRVITFRKRERTS